MRLLANENFPYDAVAALQAQGHDVVWIRAVAPGSSDVDVLRYAERDTRILLTFDKDFGELAFHSKLPASCGIILFRIPMTSAAEIAQRVTASIASRDDWAGHFAVIDLKRVRMRSLLTLI